VIVVLLFLEIPTELLSREIEKSVIDAQARREEPTEEDGKKFLEDYMRSAGSWVWDVERWLEEKYGGAEGYLVAAGVSRKALGEIERLLLVEGSEKLVEV
jgi:hypothetical protein